MNLKQRFIFADYKLDAPYATIPSVDPHRLRDAGQDPPRLHHHQRLLPPLLLTLMSFRTIPSPGHPNPPLETALLWRSTQTAYPATNDDNKDNEDMSVDDDLLDTVNTIDRVTGDLPDDETEAVLNHTVQIELKDNWTDLYPISDDGQGIIKILSLPLEKLLALRLLAELPHLTSGYSKISAPIPVRSSASSDAKRDASSSGPASLQDPTTTF